MLTDLRRLANYNLRILLGHNAWLLIVPVVASQLIVFWHMAIAALVTPATIARSFELVLPLIAAFLSAQVVAPEHQNRVDELTFVRPVPFARTIILRLVALYLIVFLLGAMMLFVYVKGLQTPFEVAPTVLAGVPPLLFLSLLSLAFASAWRSAAVGIGAALACWGVDVAWGSGLNPLFTLHGYAAALAEASGGAVSQDWLASKGVLLALTLLVGLVARSGLGRPASPHRLRAGLRVIAAVVPLTALYLGTGAYWQLLQVRPVEATHPRQARTAYQRAFAGFGPLPVPLLFGSVFADYIGYPHQARMGFPQDAGQRRAQTARLLSAALRQPDSEWADNALFEIIKLGGSADADPQVEGDWVKEVPAYCRLFLERYPTSPFAPEVAAIMVRLAAAREDTRTMLYAYDRAVRNYRGTQGASDAADLVRAYYHDHGQQDRALEAARMSAELAPPTSKPEALLRLGGFLAQQGHVAEAREALKQVDAAVQDKLVALGLDAPDMNRATVDVLRERSAVLDLRRQARAALAALDAPSAAPPTHASRTSGPPPAQ